MPTNNSTGETVAQIPGERTMVQRIQRKRVVSQTSNPVTTSILKVIDDLKTKTRREAFYAFDSGKEDPNRFFSFITTQNLDEF